MSETPSEIAVLRAALAAAEARASAAEGALVAAKGELTQVQAIVSASEDMIRHFDCRSPNSGASNMAIAPNAMPG
jgi:hypothetical protein